MFEYLPRRTLAIAVTALMAAGTVGGVAVANSGSGTSSGGPKPTHRVDRPEAIDTPDAAHGASGDTDRETNDERGVRSDTTRETNEDQGAPGDTDRETNDDHGARGDTDRETNDEHGARGDTDRGTKAARGTVDRPEPGDTPDAATPGV